MADQPPRDEGGQFTDPDDDEAEGGTGDTETKSTRTRWRWTGTLAALLLVSTACAVILLYAARGVKVPLWATGTFGLATLASVAWAFGESALKAARDSGGK